MEKSHSRAKGIAFKELLVWLDRRLGRDQLLRAIARLPSEYQGIVNPDVANFGILSASWYPFPCVHMLLDGLTASMPRPERIALAQEASRAIMDITLNSVHKWVMRSFVSPTMYAKFANRLWQSYYDSGEFAVIITEDGLSADCTVRNWSGHHPFVCDMNVAAASAIYQAMGQAGAATERLSCIGDGGTVCRYITSWGGRRAKR